MDKLLVCLTVIPIASEQAKAAKINTTVFIQKATCIVVEKNVGAPESVPRTRPTKPVTRLQPSRLVCLLNYNLYLVSVFSFQHFSFSVFSVSVFQFFSFQFFSFQRFPLTRLEP